MRSVAFSPDGAFIKSGYNDYKVILWGRSTGNLLKTFEGQTHYVRSVAFSPDGAFIVNDTNDYQVKLCEK